MPAETDDLVALARPLRKFGAEIGERVAHVVENPPVEWADLSAGNPRHGAGRTEVHGERLAAPCGLDDQDVVGGIVVAQHLAESVFGAELGRADPQKRRAEVALADGATKIGASIPPPGLHITTGSPGAARRIRRVDEQGGVVVIRK